MPLDNEKLITLKQVCKVIPSKPARQTVIRWMRLGLSGILFEHMQIGTRVYTSAEAWVRFERRVREARIADLSSKKFNKEKKNV